MQIHQAAHVTGAIAPTLTVAPDTAEPRPNAPTPDVSKNLTVELLDERIAEIAALIPHLETLARLDFPAFRDQWKADADNERFKLAALLAMRGQACN